MQIQGLQTNNNLHLSEEILVISTKNLFSKIDSWQGINQKAFADISNLVQEHGSFMPRSHAETDFSHKQIIPYLLFTFDQKLFVMQRKKTASEQRLASKFSLGIGGHIRQEDIQNNNVLEWAMREFQEEVNYHGTIKATPIGILNDDSSDVGKVHMGIIWIISGNSDQISIKDEHKSGLLMTIDECKKIYDNMENWSKICLDFLLQNTELMK
jgi:predicted NUDIX family phosphoesterase